jgi:arylformamidase
VSTTETGDRRVQFDFEIEFANGGGIQGQGFRLDIEGDDISDAELAEYIVRDFRLLMVSETRILSKTIVTERHKRAAAAVPVEKSATDWTHIDLSHAVEDGMMTYPGLPAPVISDLVSREASRGHYAPGTEFQIGSIQLCANTGTYVDSPFHRYADGIDLAELPVERLADLEAIVVNVVGNQDRAIDRDQLVPYDVEGRAVLVHTGWDRHWSTDAYLHNHPFLTAEAARLLVEAGAALVGIDSLNIDDTSTGERPVHTALLAAEIPVCEHLTHLDRLPAQGFRFSAVPVKVRGMGTFPVRAYASLG